MSAYDHRAAALIRSTLHGYPANEAIMGTLLEHAKRAGSVELPSSSRYQALLEALKALSPAPLGSPPPSPPASPPARPAPLLGSPRR